MQLAVDNLSLSWRDGNGIFRRLCSVFHFYNLQFSFDMVRSSSSGPASCLFNLINWRSVSHKFAHFKNAQKTLNSPGCCSPEQIYLRRYLWTEQGRGRAGQGRAAVPWPVHVAHTSQHLGKWKEIAVDSIRVCACSWLASVLSWPGSSSHAIHFLYATICLWRTCAASTQRGREGGREEEREGAASETCVFTSASISCGQAATDNILQCNCI